MQPWFFYGIIPAFIYIAIGIILLIPIIGNKRIFYFSSKQSIIIPTILFAITISTYGIGMNINGFISYLPVIAITYLILNIRPDFSCYLISFITKYLAIFISISLFFYIIFLLVPMQLPMYYPPNGMYPNGFANQFINIIITIIPHYYRFQSVFIEPGHMVMGIYPLIFLNRYNIKNIYVIILIIAVILSLSLAGFIYFILGPIILTIFQGKLKTIIISFLLSVICIIGIYIYSENNPDSILTLAIVNRLEYSPEDNSIAGDNRVTGNIKVVYEKVIKSDDIWFGTSKYDYIAEEGGNNGYKIILVRWGIFQLFMISISFLSIALYSNNKIVLAYVLLLLLMISQNYYPYWPSMLINLICGSKYIKYQWPKSKYSKQYIV